MQQSSRLSQLPMVGHSKIYEMDCDSWGMFDILEMNTEHKKLKYISHWRCAASRSFETVVISKSL